MNKCKQSVFDYLFIFICLNWYNFEFVKKKERLKKGLFFISTNRHEPEQFESKK